MKVFICQWITILCLLSLTSALELYHLRKVVDFVKNITSGEIEQRLKPRGIHDQNTIFDDDLSKFSRRPWTKPSLYSHFGIYLLIFTNIFSYGW